MLRKRICISESRFRSLRTKKVLFFLKVPLEAAMIIR
jgi:hypothetical protein